MNLFKNGLALILLSDLLFAFVPITVKWAHQAHYSAVEVTFYRFAFAFLGIGFLAGLGVQKIKPVKYKAVFWRGVFGGMAVFFYFISLDYTTAARATLWNYTYSIWANLFSIFWLKRSAPKHFGWMLLLGVAGVWLVMGTGLENFQPGDIAGLLSGACAGASVVAIKEARRTDNALTIFTSFTLFGFLFAGIFLAFAAVPGIPASMEFLGHWTPILGRGWMLLSLMGLFAMSAQLLLTQSFGYLSLPMGTLLSLLVPIGAAFFGLLILGESLTPHFLLGTLLVLSACAWLGWSESRD